MVQPPGIGHCHVNWDYPDPHLMPIVVSPADIDGLGHANNACYVQWCEQCAWQHSEALGLSVADYQALDRGVAIHKASYQYFLPGLEGDALVVATWLTACDRKLRLERSFQVVDTRSQATVMRGHWMLVCTTLSTGKATRFPARFLEVYGGAVIPVKNSG